MGVRVIKNFRSAIFSAVIGALLAVPALGDADAREFRVGTIVPAAHVWSQKAAAMGDAIKQKSGGSHTVTLFPAGQLGDESQMVQQLQTGALDMAFLTIADVSNRIPAFGALYTPFLVKNVADAARLLKGPTARKLLDQLPQKMGVVGVGYGLATLRQMLAAAPVNSVADLAGKKMRITPFKPFRDLYSIIGIAPTPMPLPDVYDALANGQVDAIDTDTEQILIFRFDQRAKYLLMTNHAMFPMVGLISGRTWRQLSDSDKELLKGSMAEALDEILTTYVKLEPELKAKVKATGIEVKEVGREFFPGVVEKWEKAWENEKPVIDQLRAEAAK